MTDATHPDLNTTKIKNLVQLKKLTYLLVSDSDGHVLRAGRHVLVREVNAPEDVPELLIDTDEVDDPGTDDAPDDQLTIIVTTEEVTRSPLIPRHQPDTVHRAVVATVQPPSQFPLGHVPGPDDT